METQNLELRVKVKSDSEPKVTWMQEGKEVIPSPRVKVTKTKDVFTLTLLQITQRMAGKYSCIAANPHGRVEHHAQITVTGRYPRLLVRSSYIGRPLYFRLIFLNKSIYFILSILMNHAYLC